MKKVSSRQKKDSKDDSAHALTPGKKTPTNGEVLMKSLLDHIAGLKVSTVISEKTDSPPSPPPGSHPEHSESTPGYQNTGQQNKRYQWIDGPLDAQCQALIYRVLEKAHRRKAHDQKEAQEKALKESKKCQRAQYAQRIQPRKEQKKAEERAQVEDLYERYNRTTTPSPPPSPPRSPSPSPGNERCTSDE